MIRVNNKNTGRRSGIFIINLDHISHLFLVFLLLTLNKIFEASLLLAYY